MAVGFVGNSAIGHDETNDGDITTGAYTVIGGTDKIILIDGGARNTGTAPTSVTYDGGADLIGGADEVTAWFNNGNYSAGLWRVIDPTAGSKTATMTFAGNTRPKHLQIIEYSGAETTSAINTATGTNTAPAVSLTTISNNSMAVGLITQDGNLQTTPIYDWTGGSEAGETERIDRGSSAGANAIHYSVGDIIKATAGAQDLSATSDSDGQWLMIGVEITEEVVAAVYPPFPRLKPPHVRM